MVKEQTNTKESQEPKPTKPTKPRSPRARKPKLEKALDVIKAEKGTPVGGATVFRSKVGKENYPQDNTTPWLLQLEYRLVFGKKLFYPFNKLAIEILKLCNRISFTLEEARKLKELGFKINLVTFDLTDLI